MKQIYTIFSCLFLCMATSCSDMLSDIQEYLDEGETIYVGKLDSILVSPGRNRIKIEGLMPYGMTQTNCIISWLDPAGETGTKEFPIQRTSMDDYFEFFIEDLLEGQHDFTIVTRDAKGNSSIQVEVGGYSYGDIYISTLQNREIVSVSSPWQDESQVWNVSIEWLSLYNDDVIACLVEYETEEGLTGSRLIPISETTTQLTGIKPSGVIRWSTVYLPDIDSIDLFYTEKEVVRIPE